MPDPKTIVTVSTQGGFYRSWKTVQVRRDFGNGVSVFSFSASEVASGRKMSATLLKPGDAVAISLGGVQIINGYITKRQASFDKESHDLVIQGKSRTCDVADSSVIINAGDYKGYNVQQIANGVMQPHGVSFVTRNPPPGWDRPFDFATPHYGETCFSFINRLCNQRGLLITDDKDGNLVAGQADQSAAPVADLVEGRNILRAVGVLDDENAWSTTGMIQQYPGTDQNWGTTRAAAATVQNPGLTRENRVRLVHGDMTGDSAQLATRTSFENMLTASTIVTASVTVVGWFKLDGTLWKEGDNVTVRSPMLFPMATDPVKLSVQSVTYAQDPGEGTTTTLELVQPQRLGSTIDPTYSQGQPEPAPAAAQPAAPDTPVKG